MGSTRPAVGTTSLASPRGWPRRSILLLALPVSVALLPSGSLRCDAPYLRSDSPESDETLQVCRRPMPFALPGQGSDAPGWSVLRDRDGLIENVVDVDLVGAIDRPVEWTAAEVSLPLVAGHARHAGGAWWQRWLRDRVWRLRALVGLTPGSAAFR